MYHQLYLGTLPIIVDILLELQNHFIYKTWWPETVHYIYNREKEFGEKCSFPEILANGGWMPTRNDAKEIWGMRETERERDLLLSCHSSCKLLWQLSTLPFLISPSCIPFIISTSKRRLLGNPEEIHCRSLANRFSPKYPCPLLWTII